jgi:hypothetical protein
LLAEAGAEYFLHKQFSIEGKVGFGYTLQDRTTTSTVGLTQTTRTVRTTDIGTERLGISFNFYF